MCLTHTEGKFTLTVKAEVSEREEMRVDPAVRPTLAALCISLPLRSALPGLFYFLCRRGIRTNSLKFISVQLQNSLRTVTWKSMLTVSVLQTLFWAGRQRLRSKVGSSFPGLQPRGLSGTSGRNRPTQMSRAKASSHRESGH